MALLMPDVTSTTLVLPTTTSNVLSTNMTGFLSRLPGAAYIRWPWQYDVLRFSYLSFFASKWCLLMILTTILLNRTTFLATPRGPAFNVRFYLKAILFAAPIALLCFYTTELLKALHCQTGRATSGYRIGNSLAFDGNKDNSTRLLLVPGPPEGAWIHYTTSFLLNITGSSDLSCHVPNDPATSTPHDHLGSFALLWPIFLTLCINHFIDALISALQSRLMLYDHIMSNLELSLAFFECESTLAAAVAMRNKAFATLGTHLVVKTLDAPIDLLLVCIVTCLCHMSSSFLSIMDKRDQTRLVTTSTFGLMYVAIFTWDLGRIYSSPLDSLSIMRMPAVCIARFLPHVLLLYGVAICGLILLVAVVVAACSAPGNITLKDSWRHAMRNLQATTQLQGAAGLRIDWREDFQTCLSRNAIAVLGAAHKSAFLREVGLVDAPDLTWLECDRMFEMGDVIKYSKNVQLQAVSGRLNNLQARCAQENGHAIEHKSTPDKGQRGLDVQKAPSVWQRAMAVGGAISASVLALQRLYRHGPPSDGSVVAAAHTTSRTLRSTPSSRPTSSRDREDTEIRYRRSIKQTVGHASDDYIDERLYQYWQTGPAWGNLDSSGDYKADETDDDLTSVVSFSTTDDGNDSGSDGMSSGQRTPTQNNPTGGDDKTDLLDPAQLARLLNPLTDADRDEARLLAAHLRARGPVTRARYAWNRILDMGNLLQTPTSARHPMAQSTLESEQEQTSSLERFILERRENARSRRSGPDSYVDVDADTSGVRHGGDGSSSGTSWQQGGSGLGDDGPQCVVCQAAPRTILVWPCGCLCVCDDCRLGIAVKNFRECLCCRTKVEGYSKLLVP